LNAGICIRNLHAGGICMLLVYIKLSYITIASLDELLLLLLLLL
jgi:hypothetical protein